MHMSEILDAAELPIRYAGLSTCFRREAGAAGKDTRGMFRVHQFNKVEMYVFTDPQDSRTEQERMVALEEALLQELGIPYRAVDVAAGDLGASATRKIDLEAWFPAQGRYREVTSCSNTTDFQARRLGIRVRSESGLVPPHTLNGTVVTDRFVLAILENFQGAVPEPLQKYGAPSLIEA
jgi:seryl-tRNA synthetase